MCVHVKTHVFILLLINVCVYVQTSRPPACAACVCMIQNEFSMQTQYLCIIYLLEFLGLGLHLLLQRSESLSQLQRLLVLGQHLLLNLPLAT